MPSLRSRLRPWRWLLLASAALCTLQLRPRALGGGPGPAYVAAKGDPLLAADAADAQEADPPPPPPPPGSSDEGRGVIARSPWTVSLLVYALCVAVAKTEPPPPTGTPPRLRPEVLPLEKRPDFRGVLVMSTLLSLVSGMVNALAIIEMGATVAHHTGNASHAGRLLGADGLRFVGLMVAYTAGATLAGYCKVDGEALFARRYSPGMLSAAIAVAAGAGIYGASRNAFVALPLLCFSQGLQNAITRRCGSLPVCTTHMTGYLTDAGCGLGLWLRAGSREPLPLKTRFFVASVSAFVLGGAVAKQLRDLFGIASALAPAAVMAAAALGLVPLPPSTAAKQGL